jgi:hypothetical protein
MGVSSAIRLIGKVAKPGNTELKYSRTGTLSRRQVSTTETIAATRGRRLPRCQCGSNSFQGRPDVWHSRRNCYSAPARDIPGTGSAVSPLPLRNLLLCCHPRSPPKKPADEQVGMVRRLRWKSLGLREGRSKGRSAPGQRVDPENEIDPD